MDKLLESIWRIGDGVPLAINNMIIKTTDSGKLLITRIIENISLDCVSRLSIETELSLLRKDYMTLSNKYPDLNKIKEYNQLNIEFHIACYSSVGQIIGLCSQIQNEINWYI
jgi:hypothetical protein